MSDDGQYHLRTDPPFFWQGEEAEKMFIAQDAAAAARAEYEPVMVELARLVDVLVHHGVDLERIEIDGGAGIVREAIRFLEETVQARDLRHEQAQRWAKLNMGLLARIDSLKRVVKLYEESNAKILQQIREIKALMGIGEDE